MMVVRMNDGGGNAVTAQVYYIKCVMWIKLSDKFSFREELAHTPDGTFTLWVLLGGLLKGSMDELGKINRFCPNPCFLPHIWTKLNRILSKSMLFTPHLDETQSYFVQIYAFYPTFGRNFIAYSNILLTFANKITYLWKDL